ncbi:unnamed protein product [Mytilus coruscus]|uniref:Uncharacterized protein n=1 Tax=Mytilus coruscus TaxID=42192 RepID=A0A6J8B9N4_MYTCO|nr:unnamed protein product [Mytilus coruscus]
MYTAGSKKHNCHCKYTANPISLNDLDLTLLSLILLNCCSLSSNEGTLISDLREFKNNFLSHNTDGAISETEYSTLWTDLTSYVLQLDPSKQNDLVIIQNRPLDESLCQYYVTSLLDVHVILEKIDTKIDATSAEIRTTIANSNTEVMETIGAKTFELLATMGINNVVLMAKIEEVLQNMICQRCKRNIHDQGFIHCNETTEAVKPNVSKVVSTVISILLSIHFLEKQEGLLQPYKLGQSLFTLHHHVDLTSVVGENVLGEVSNIVMMEDGRLVICLPHQDTLLIYYTDGSQVNRIDVQGVPWCVTAVNNFTVAVTLVRSNCIEIYDINNKLKLKSISISAPGMWWWSDITTINSKLVVEDDDRLLIIDHQTREAVQTIQTDCFPYRLHGSGDRIFYCDEFCKYNNKLYWYHYTDDSHHNLSLPSPPWRMTTLRDGSLYVVCEDGSVQHVSSDGKQYTTATTKELKTLSWICLSYNSKQRKLVTISNLSGKLNVLYEN